MKRTIGLAFLVLWFSAAMVGCGASPAAPTPDVDATVAAALAATTTAQADLQQTIDAAVQSTGAAAPTPAAPATPDTQATIEAAVRGTLAAAPTPAPAAEYVAMSEEDLAALVDESVATATAASEASATAVTAATADEALTADEVARLVTSVDETAALITDAEDLLTAYESLYGGLATETAAVLQAMEEDLAIIAANTTAMATTLEAMNTTLQQGLALSQETIDQLEAAAQAANVKALELQQQAQGWIAQLPVSLEGLAATILAVQPDNIPTDRAAALQSAFAYVDGVRQALADNRLSKDELLGIAQLGANASAGLAAHGGPALQGLAGSITDITGKMARGQVPQAKTGLSALESGLGSRPGRP